MEEEEKGGGRQRGPGKGAEGRMERKARSLRMRQLSLGKVSSAPNGTTGSFSMKSLIC